MGGNSPTEIEFAPTIDHIDSAPGKIASTIGRNCSDCISKWRYRVDTRIIANQNIF